MPYSDNSFNDTIQKLFAKRHYTHYLDIGTGAGKYADLIRAVIPNAFIEGIEGDKQYVRQFKLKEKYDRLYQTKVEHFFDDKPNYTTDVVIFGDVIEHLKKSAGVDLLHYFAYRAKLILVAFPTKYVQYDLKGHGLEAHCSVWDKSDFRYFDHKLYTKGLINLAVITGYLDSTQQAVIVTDDMA